MEEETVQKASASRGSEDGLAEASLGESRQRSEEFGLVWKAAQSQVVVLGGGMAR